MKNVYEIINEIRAYAKEEKVPIMMDDGLKFLIEYIAKNKIQSVLEIGTAIGYSSIMMALSNPSLTITTIERDEKRYLEALKNIKKLKLEDRITLIFNDALDVSLSEKYDLIFIDAAKAQSIKFFEKFEKNLNPSGTIITDNLKFHGLVDKDEEEIESRNLRALVRKIKEYISFLKGNINYKTDFYELGDGISVSKRIEEK
ncbi:MAG: O-methyltransferase [Bacilli bacterium]|nr:O-methyltransferase [Mycoplasmatota bacterium]MDD6264070.1 O-methyltransferase [bacterium]MDY2697294.1 O-methyltransferase [Bacilli bacterium]MDD6941082.1 O-methyltransferase [bacterium]MDY5992487.1 O-methyltransferase [Bacilli bacterium]